MDPTLAKQGYVKIRMSDDDGHTETLWATMVTPGSTFKLDNSPFYAYRVSEGDIVEAALVADGFYDFVRVVERSGNRTVRVILGDGQADSAWAENVLAGVVALGCTYEGMYGRLISITVPAAVSLPDVARYLTSTGLEWEYADPTYGDIYGES